MPIDIADHLLERFCAGDCTPAERAEVERWLAADPARAESLDLLRAAWLEAGTMETPAERPDITAAWTAVERRVRAGERAALRIGVSFEERSAGWRRSWMRGAVAAAAVLVIAAGVSFVALRRSTAPADANAVAATFVRDVVTRRGQRAALDLPDGSRVVLAAESRLRLPSTFVPNAGPRDIYLEGEAFFEVQHDAARPFRVHAANGVAEDLGTEFVVSAYPETRGMQVVVASGAVALRTAESLRDQPRALLTLAPGDLGRLDATGTATLTRGVALAPYVAWADGQLVFDSTRVRDALPRLARWFDLDIHLADSTLADRRLTVTFRNETAGQALDLLALALDARVERHGRAVVVRTARS